MQELELLVELFKGTKRQGPGSDEDTLKALWFMDLPKNRKLKVADLGCGTGGQTLTLAKHLNAHIQAVDLFPAFLEQLEEQAQQLNLHKNIETIEASIDALPFEKESLDLIWSEGAIYNIGFETGVKQWRPFLKPGGYLAVSELTWITPERPEIIENHWNNEYPEVALASQKIEQLESNGYALVGYFYLPPGSWLEHYYQPLQEKFNDFLKRYKGNAIAQSIIDEQRNEIELYLTYQNYFSYGFYIAQKH